MKKSSPKSPIKNDNNDLLSSLSPYESPITTPEQKKEVYPEKVEEIELIMSEKKIKEQVKLLKELNKYKTNVNILTIDNAIILFHNLELYMNKKFTDRDGVIRKFLESLVKRGLLFDVDTNSCYYPKEIDTFELYYTEKELSDIFEKIDLNTNNNAFYLYNFITSAFSASSHLIMRYKIDKDTVKFCMNSLSKYFEKTVMGEIFYMDYFNKKYNNSICFSIFYDIDTFILLLSETLVVIASYADKPNDKIPSDYLFQVELYRLFKKYNYNCNLYYSYVIDFVVGNYLYPNHFKYDFRIKGLDYTNNTSKQIYQCYSSDKNYIVIPFYLVSENFGHQNILIVDKKRKLVERFDPHGYFFNEDTSDVDTKLSDFFKSKFGEDYKFSSDSCIVGVQYFEEFMSSKSRGKCVSLSFQYLEERLENIQMGKNETEVQATTRYRNRVIKEEPFQFFKNLKEFIANILKESNYMFEIINDNLGTSYYIEGGNMLSFRDEECKKLAQKKKSSTRQESKPKRRKS